MDGRVQKIVIVGGGISGLATGYAIERQATADGRKVDVTLIESGSRLGGKIRSERIDGYLLESGPFGFLSNKPETRELVKDVGIGGLLLNSNDASRKRFIYTGGQLQKLPENPPAFLTSKILSWGSKLGMLREPWTKPASAGKDETIAEFAERHLGKEATARLIDAMAAGVFAGSAYELSLKSCFPVMADLEREGDGSLFRAMMRRRKKKNQAAKAQGAPKTEKKPGGSIEMGGGTLTTFKDGMETLTSAVANKTAAKIIPEAKVEKVERSGAGWKVRMADKKVSDADAVILAVPAYAAAAIIESIDDASAQLLRDIPYVAVNVVNLGYARDKISDPLDGFGFLIPGIEKRKILGAIWASSTFSGFAPENNVALRVMVGGARNPDVAAFDDQETLDTIQRELKSTMDIDADPDFVNIIRHERAIPQYVIGHGERLDQLDGRMSHHPGLFLTGNAYRGIGVNDCTRNAQTVAARVLQFLKDSAAKESSPVT